MKYEITSKINGSNHNCVRITLEEPNPSGYYPVSIAVYYTLPRDRTRCCIITCCFPYKRLDEYIVENPMDLQYDLHEKHALPLIVYIANALTKKKVKPAILFDRILNRVNKSIAWYNSTYLADIKYKLPMFKFRDTGDLEDRDVYTYSMPFPDICLGL